MIYLHESLEEKRAQRRKDKLERLARMNKQHCDVKPVYGQDLCEAVNILRADSVASLNINNNKDCDSRWRMGQGYLHCEAVHRARNPYHPAVFWHQTDALRNIVHSPEQYLFELKEILEHYTFCVPPVMAPRITMHTSHPPPSLLNAQRHLEHMMHAHVSPKAECLHPVSSRNHVQFPEARLIQYDCGKCSCFLEQMLQMFWNRNQSKSHQTHSGDEPIMFFFNYMVATLNA